MFDVGIYNSPNGHRVTGGAQAVRMNAETPIDLNQKLRDNKGELVNSRYQKLVGKLIYLSRTRPDIAFAVSLINLAASSTIKVLERPDLLSPQRIQASVNDQLHKVISRIQKPDFSLLALKGSSSLHATRDSTHIPTESGDITLYVTYENLVLEISYLVPELHHSRISVSLKMKSEYV
ncbi:hypothetical protein RJ639_039335 [Escallonia herrerae]|uniref:Uncharacterized protein n=1 Tax=Escallonia herrerae TaxID=1293975 RepID=A0AA88WIX9_9ASTE|nr:hypothetical protein RJ639_039335 [Escallonia herrerae]